MSGRHVRQFLEQARPFRSALDVRPGDGALLAAVHRAVPGAELHALEAEPTRQPPLRALGASVFSAALERDALPFPDGSIDLVLLNHVLEHVRELFWVMHEVSRVLPVGGSLVILAPNLATLGNRLRLLLGHQPHTPGAGRGFTRRGLVRLLQDAYPNGYRLAQVGGSRLRVVRTVSRELAVRLVKQREYRREFLEYPTHEHLSGFYLGP